MDHRIDKLELDAQPRTGGDSRRGNRPL